MTTFAQGYGGRRERSKWANNYYPSSGIGIWIRKNVQAVLGKDYIPVAAKSASIKNEGLLNNLARKGSGDWVKVYEVGYKNGRRVEVHYFADKKTGKVFDVKIKHDGKWSNQFNNVK